MMNPCTKCLENNWGFVCEDGWITATCNFCSHEVAFESKKFSKKEAAEGDPCRDCRGTLSLKECSFKASKLKKPYYYTAYLRCISCRKNFYIDKYKVHTGFDVNAELKANI